MAKNKAYTLIELIVVISIIILISGLTLAYYNNFSEQQKLESETNKIVSVLETAKKKALVADLQNINCQEFSGYTVSFTSNSYSMKLNCVPDCGNSCKRSFNLPSTNFFLVASGSSSLIFKPMYGGTDLSDSINITVTNSLIKKCKTIIVTNEGIITIASACP